MALRPAQGHTGGVMSALPRRRTVISLSLSATNPDALLVAQMLADQGVGLGRSGGQILAWAAAYLSGATAVPPATAEPIISEEELDQLLEDF